MKIAVIKAGGKQYKVAEGQSVKLEKIDKEIGAEVNLETLLVASGGDVEIGRPSLGEKVAAKIVEHGKGEKVNVVKFKNKVRYKRNIGHRQPFTKVEILKINK